MIAFEVGQKRSRQWDKCGQCGRPFTFSMTLLCWSGIVPTRKRPVLLHKQRIFRTRPLIPRKTPRAAAGIGCIANAPGILWLARTAHGRIAVCGKNLWQVRNGRHEARSRDLSPFTGFSAVGGIRPVL